MVVVDRSVEVVGIVLVLRRAEPLEEPEVDGDREHAARLAPLIRIARGRRFQRFTCG